ncbi:hydroxymethylglutaryl-CoA lyase [Candidatus Acetothermia bacterium]|nr:hydroxymethylglutaryl-CoA lyase [Candidatus Acetothermia bacterium]MBI3644044.1 hydroxymethylglutaryl-CoA lyase [Candidatus Acetothermia bacterium]
MITITEVGPRDGLQNEKAQIPTTAKIAFVNALSESGVQEIEVSSFVSPKWVPQLADALEVFQRIQRQSGVIYSALVPNEKGLEHALEAHVNKISIFTAASETFNQKNINASISESIERFRPVIAIAKAEKLPIRGYVSTAFYCPYEGKIPSTQVVAVVQKLLDLGVDEVSLGDTIGKAAPGDIRELLDNVMPILSKDQVVLHLHDTYGLAIANAMTAWSEYRITRFDSSAGGLGGCPYAPGAFGNVATEDLVYALRASGAEISVDIAKIVGAAKEIEPQLNRTLASRLSRVLSQSPS